MKKLAIVCLVAVAIAGCGARTESMHERLLSRFPQYLVRKAFESHNNLLFYSFDTKAILSSLKETPAGPSEAGNKMALVGAWDFPPKSDFDCENPAKYDGFATCLYDGIQVATPPLDFGEFMKRNGAIVSEADRGTTYKIKPASRENPKHPLSASSDGNVVAATKSFREETQRAVTLLVSGQDKPITDYDSVRICLDELAGYPAMVLAFCSESFYSRASVGGIQSPVKSVSQIMEYARSFETWGRSPYIQNAAFGSKWINGVENVKGVFVYLDEEKAREDLERFARASVAIPSFYTGAPWYERMNMTVPLMIQEGRKVTIEFDMKERTGEFQFPLLMRMVDKFEDWGWLWLK